MADYGFCGYFQVTTRRDVAQLRQFCFSCRILGMGVEAWVHQRLGKPALQTRGEVLSDPVAAAPVDWIHSGHIRVPIRHRRGAGGRTGPRIGGGAWRLQPMAARPLLSAHLAGRWLENSTPCGMGS